MLLSADNSDTHYVGASLVHLTVDPSSFMEDFGVALLSLYELYLKMSQQLNQENQQAIQFSIHSFDECLSLWTSNAENNKYEIKEEMKF